MREAFGTEQGDEFMSLVYALDAEARGLDPAMAHAAQGELERMLGGQATLQAIEPVAEPRIERFVPVPARPVPAPHRLVPVAAPHHLVPVSAPRPLAPVPVRALRPSTLVDELTGIGGPLALKRDVMLESSLPTPRGPRFALISIDVHPVAAVRQQRGEALADQLFKTLVDAVRLSLGPSDSIYRSGQDELTLLLRGRDPGAGDRAPAEMEAALRRALADRGLPLVRLSTATKGPRPEVAERQTAAV
jgi:GGDEF domain-containing protein